MDHAAWLAGGMSGTDEDAQAAYKYFMRPDPDQREFLGHIEHIQDPVTGREMRTRKARIGMVRNAQDKDKREVTVYLDPLPHIRLEKGKDLQGWYQPKFNDKQGSRPRPCMTDAVLTEPYGGYCTVGCAFCYVNSGFRGYRGSGLISVPLNYGAHVAKQLASMRSAAAGYFSSFTDPFLPLEDYYGNTRAGATAFVNAGLPIFFLSRLSYPGWAYDLLSKSPYSYAQKSINTPDPDDWRKLSPGALGLEEHLAEIRTLSKAGIYVSIQCNPVIPGITNHEDIEQLIEMLAQAGANHVIVKFVEAGYSWAGAMTERIAKRFGDNRAAGFRDLFTENSCGAQRTVDREYRLEGHRRYRTAATRAGLTYATCYEYDKGPDGNWRSIGGDFLTGDQCHGHRVPMFARPHGSLSAPFREIYACPPSGCLTCGDKTGSVPCGSALLGNALDLRLKDFRADPEVTNFG